MVSLTDTQLASIMDVAATITPDRRAVYLERCGAMLKLRGRFTDDDARQVAGLAACGLVHTDAA